MKKLVLFAAFVVAVSLSACSSKTQEAAPATETEVLEAPAVEAPVVEEAPADTTVTPATPAQ